VCSAVVLAGAASYAFLLGCVEPVKWDRSEFDEAGSDEPTEEIS